MWYGGNSITNGVSSPLNAEVFLSIIPETTIADIPSKYALGATHQAPPNKAPENKAITGSFAPHGIKVVVIIVIFLSAGFSIVLEAIIPGTPHPVPIRIGINDFPDRPNFLKTSSIIKATRDIYPQPSKKARNIKSTIN